MFSALRRLIGLIEVSEQGDLIKVSGLPGDSVAATINEVWGTSKIVANMFSKVSASDITFNKWFAPDVVYCFARIVAEKRKGHNIRALKKVITGIYENTWMKQTLIKHPDILDFNQLHQLEWSPLDHQMNFFKWFNEMLPRFGLKGAMLGAGPGTGKTFMGIALSLMLHADVVIIVCPSRAVKKVWEDTISTQFKRIPKYWHSQMGTAPTPGKQYYIVHYDSPESLQRFMVFAKTQHWHRPVILLDESHGMNEEMALRTDLFIQLVVQTRCQYVLWESGTPVKALGGEMAPLFRTIDAMFDPDAQERFRAIYGKASSRANDILSHRLGKVTYKVDSNQVVTISTHHHPTPVVIPNGNDYTLQSIRNEMRAFIAERVKHYSGNMRQYERMFEGALSHFYRSLVTSQQKDDFKQYEKYIKMIKRGYDPKLHKAEAAWCNKYEKQVIMPGLPKPYREEFKESKSVVKYYKLKVQGEALGQILGRKRAQCIMDMVPHMGLEKIIDDGLKKTLMFTSYVGVVDAAADYLKQRGYKPLRVYGETNNELASMVTEFGRDEDANPMIATYQSLSSAVPLVMANTMAMANSPFRSFEYDQAVARCKRLGQDEDVNVFDMVLDTGQEPNISSRTIDIMNWSREQVDALLGFENTPLIAAESADGIIALFEHHIAHEDIVDQEFDEEMMALEGVQDYTYSMRREPAWAQWASR
ncbi:DEAD/DEAH box helicase [Paraburkholderia sp. BCC1886]|uniref:DEAD/DEAH box helicase n=1 Tax=Paraburkholderia sp. BCC1886 TaxID=2562670 RepID=UPI0011825E7C|nr:DEAD/DEAH box helicase [Paraburkholderia sp. BCC1886]